MSRSRPEAKADPHLYAWRCYTCREGIHLKREWPGEKEKGYFLPDPSIADDEIFAEPPLELELGDDEISELTSPHSRSAVAATYTGPPQDKKHNEDFALTAVIRGKEDEPWLFAAVADGVSTKTFWPARTARLSILVAYLLVRQATRSGFDGSNHNLDQLRQGLAKSLKRWLRSDQEFLKERGLCPQGWNPETFRQFASEDEYWYNSTLLVACLGPKEAFLLWAGDGGIQILKDRRREETAPLRSTDDLTVGTFVSLAVESTDFMAARISYPDRGKALEVFLSSDGVDRTLQRESIPYKAIQPLSDAGEARLYLHELAKRKHCEVDNYSLAWISGPPPASFPWRVIPKVSASPDPLPPVVLPLQEQKPGSGTASGGGESQTETSLMLPDAIEEREKGEPAKADAVEAARKDFLGFIANKSTLLAIGFAMGFVVAVLVFALVQRPGSVEAQSADQPEAALRGDPQPPPTSAIATLPPVLPPPEKLEPATALEPIALEEADRKDLDESKVSDAIARQLAVWAETLKADAGAKPRLLVVYGYREDESAQDCRKQHDRSRERAKILTQRLRALLGPAEQGRLDPVGRAEVCHPPAGFADLHDTAVVRAVLVSSAPACICPGGSKTSSLPAPVDRPATPPAQAEVQG